MHESTIEKIAVLSSNIGGAIALLGTVAYDSALMKTNPGSSAGRELSSINSSKTSTLPSKLKELKGSFALEGIEIPDERVLRYEAEFQNAKKTGRVRADIERAIRDIPE